jgi:hypothetical protein
MPLTKVDFRIPPRAREHDWSVRWGERTRQQKADIKMRNALLQFLILVVENTSLDEASLLMSSKLQSSTSSARMLPSHSRQ